MSKIEDAILNSIDILVKKAVCNINADKTILGNIISVLSNDRYNVLVNGAEYEIQGSSSVKYTLGQSVEVFVPLGDFSRISFKGTSIGGGGGGSIVEKDPTVPSWAKQPVKPTYNSAEIGLDKVDNVKQATKSEFDSHVTNHSNPHGTTKEHLGLGKVTNDKQYSDSNPPPYPVNSVNQQTGNVVISPDSIGAESIGSVNSHNNDEDAHKALFDKKIDLSGDISNTKSSFIESVSRENISSLDKISTILGKIKKWFSDLKSVAFTGSYKDLIDKPSSLPADGGNADTLGGKSSDYYAVNRTVTNTVDGLMISADKTKLDSVESNANNYAHPDTHSANIIVDASDRHFITDVQQTSLNNIDSKINSMGEQVTQYVDTNLAIKVDKVTGKGLSTEDYSTDEKNKLAGIEASANYYIHPDNVNIQHVTEAQKSLWTSKASTDLATTTNKGLMSNEDRIKIDNIENNANNYIHPTTHSADMITGLPTSLPANGGNADTLDNKHASDFAGINDVITKTNTTEYTPTLPYHPVTKKYVEDSISSSGGGDMLKSVYDTDNTGIVDNSQRLGGKTAEELIPKDIVTHTWETEVEGSVFIDADLLNGKTADDLTVKNVVTYNDETSVDDLIPIDADLLDNKPASYYASKNIATETVNGLMSFVDKNKLSTIETNANNYVHPPTHTTSIIEGLDSSLSVKKSFISRVIPNVRTNADNYNTYYEIGQFNFNPMEGVITLSLAFSGYGHGSGGEYIIPLSYSMDYLASYGLSAANVTDKWINITSKSQMNRHVLYAPNSWALQAFASANYIKFRLVIFAANGEDATATAYIKISHSNEFANCLYTELVGVGFIDKSELPYTVMPYIASGLNGTVQYGKNIIYDIDESRINAKSIGILSTNNESFVIDNNKAVEWDNKADKSDITAFNGTATLSNNTINITI